MRPRPDSAHLLDVVIVVWLLVLAAGAVASLVWPRKGHAQAYSDVTDAQLQLARVCEYESDTHRADCIAIHWVGRKRAAVTDADPIDTLLAYSTMLRTRSARARRIREGQPPAALLTLAAELLRGEHADPCPRATHWGGRADAPQGRMVPARCSMKTANTFYRVQR